MHYLETVEPVGPPSMDGVPHAGPVDQPARPRLPGVQRARVRRRGAARAIACACCPPAWKRSVAAIVTLEGDPATADAGDSITLTLTDEVDVSRGDVIAAATSPPEVADQFEARLLWMVGRRSDSGPHLPAEDAVQGSARARSRRSSIGSTSPASARLAARTLALNDIGVVNLSTTQPIPFEPYAANRTLGSFILIDPLELRDRGRRA